MEEEKKVRNVGFESSTDSPGLRDIVPTRSNLTDGTCSLFELKNQFNSSLLQPPGSGPGGPRKSRPSLMAMDIRVGNKYRLLEKLGEGGFGEIYRGMNIVTGDPVAVKLESCRAPHPALLPEARLYKMLGPYGPKGSECTTSELAAVPRVHWYGLEGDYHVMVLDLLGPSLEDIFDFYHRSFSLKTIVDLGKQMVSRVEYIHSKHMVHRDIKPDNFLLGVGSKSNTVFVIDFGLAKPYRDPRTYKHIPYRNGLSMCGTARYCSLYTHFGVTQSRRDDLEAVAYTLLYFLRGSLPWQGVRVNVEGRGKKHEAKLRHKLVMQAKLASAPSDLARGYPKEFAIFLEYCRKLRFAEKPNYAYLINLLEKVRERHGLSVDPTYEWSAQIQGNPFELFESLSDVSPMLAAAATASVPDRDGSERDMAQSSDMLLVTRPQNSSSSLPVPVPVLVSR